MAGAHESLDEDASLNTQLPFGTQAQPLARPRKGGGEIQFTAINRLEPVLAGNTQRADLKPRSTSSTKSLAEQLLSLINPRRAPVALQTQGLDRVETRPEPTITADDVDTSLPQPRETPAKRARRERIGELIASATTQTPPEKSKKRTREVEDDTPSARQSVKKTSFSGTGAKQRNNSALERFAAECSWMKGLNFNRESTTVPELQAQILSRPESWHKPQPGRRFPEANIPTQIFVTLCRMADEKLALEAALEVSSGSCNETDPSPEPYPPTSAPQPEAGSEEGSENEGPTSPISWEASPSPEPPERQTLPHQGLPPDSSVEVPVDVTESVVVQSSAVTRNKSPPFTLPPSSNEAGADAPPSSPPVPPAAENDEDDMELETSVPQALGEDLKTELASRSVQNRTSRRGPQSKSVVQVKETPYLKGKNGQPIVTISTPKQNLSELQHDSSSASIVRGTYSEFSSSATGESHPAALCRNNIERQQDNISSESLAQMNKSSEMPLHNDVQDVSMSGTLQHNESLPDLIEKEGQQGQAHSKQLKTVQEKCAAQPEPTPISSQLPSKSSRSGEQPASVSIQDISAGLAQPEREPSRQPSATPSLTKRKLQTTPTRESRRPSKHKRLKVVSFGGRNPEVLRQQRAESLRNSDTERRKSSTSVERGHALPRDLSVQHDANSKMDTDEKKRIETGVNRAGDVNESNMSPRHQSLYAEPSPILRPSAAPCTVVSVTESIEIDQMVPGPSGDNAMSEGSANHSARSRQTHMQPQPRSSTKHQSGPQSKPEPAGIPLSEAHPQAQSEAINPGFNVQVRAAQTLPVAAVNNITPLTVFETFKAAYPEYKGDARHFANQCLQIEVLDREDKMVPKWMWDDYIIRNRTDYRDYAIECLDSGEAAMPYIRFYKDTIRDTIHKKGVLETRVSLLKALEELDVQLSATPAQQSIHTHQSHQQPAQRFSRQKSQQSRQQPARQSVLPSMPPPAQSETTSPEKKRSRQSLLSTLPETPAQSHVNSTRRVRHSLPPGSSHAGSISTSAPAVSAQQPPSTRSKRKSRLAEVLAHYSKSDDPPVLAADEFRDFLKSQAALTSTTGSTRVSSTPIPPRDRRGDRIDEN